MPEMEESASESKQRSITRRKFILGVIAGGAVVGAASYKILSPGRGRSAAGERLITLNVNGKPRRVEVMRQETLAWTLRYKLGLTGTKLGCDRAECGACTVLLDDVPHYSCSVLTHTVRGTQGDDDRRAGRGRRQAASGAAGGGGRAGLPVRVLHVGVHHVGGRIPEDESQPDAGRTGARHQRQPVPVPGLHQDSGRDDARRASTCEATARATDCRRGGPEPWRTCPQWNATKAEKREAAPVWHRLQADRQGLRNARHGGEGDGHSRSMPRIFARRGCCFAGWC